MLGIFFETSTYALDNSLAGVQTLGGALHENLLSKIKMVMRVRMCALYRGGFRLSGNYEHLMKDYSSGQSPALTTHKWGLLFHSRGSSPCPRPNDCLNLVIFIILVFIDFLLLLGVLNCWFGSFVVVIVVLFLLCSIGSVNLLFFSVFCVLFMLLCVSDKVTPWQKCWCVGSLYVTRAPLLYFIRSWVALTFKVCQWVSL